VGTANPEGLFRQVLWISHSNLKMKRSFTFILFAFLASTGIISAEIQDSIRAQALGEIVVQSTRLGNKLKNIPQKIEIITKEDIQGVPNENLAEVIKRLTNVDMVQYPGVSATIGMRGFSPSALSRSYTLMLINGRPAGTTNLASIIPNNVERIEVIKGPYATLYGSDAMGGVINIITKSIGSEFQGNIKVEGGTFDFHRIEGGLSGSLLPHLRGGFNFSTLKQGQDYLIGKKNLLKMNKVEKSILDNNSYGDTMKNSVYDLNDLNGRLEWDINKRWSANAEATYTFGKDIETPGNYWGSYGYSKKQIRRYNVFGTIERKGKAGSFSFSPYFTKENEPNYSDNSSVGFVNFESKISQYGFQMQQQQAFGDFKAVAGMDFGVYDYQSERFASAGTPTTPYKPNNSHSNEALFAQINYHHDKLDVNVGARFDHFGYQIEANDSLHASASKNSYNTFNPSIGAQYQISDGLKAHASFGTAFSVPDAYKTSGSYLISIYYPEYNYTYSQTFVGNPNLKPEKSSTIDLGLSFHSPNRAFNADITYFYTHHNGKIVDKYLENGNLSYVNANKAIMNGVEWSADYDFGSLFDQHFSLELYTNWTYLFDANSSQITKSSTGADSTFTRDLLYVRKLNGNFGLSFRNQKGLSARLNARYSGSRLENDSYKKDDYSPINLRPEILDTDYTTEGGYKLSEKILKHPDFLIFDLSAQYAFKNKIALGLSLSNLFDENFTDKDGYNMPGRQIKISLGYAF